MKKRVVYISAAILILQTLTQRFCSGGKSCPACRTGRTKRRETDGSADTSVFLFPQFGGGFVELCNSDALRHSGNGRRQHDYCKLFHIFLLFRVSCDSAPCLSER